MIGENIKKYRILKGISLRKFGELVGLSQTAISKYEQNILKPDGEKLIKFAEVLDCKVLDLLKEQTKKRTLNLNFRKRNSLRGNKLELLKQIINSTFKNFCCNSSHINIVIFSKLKQSMYEIKSCNSFF